MALKCGENKKAACKVQLSVSLMLATMQYELDKLITNFAPIVSATFNNFQGFPS